VRDQRFLEENTLALQQRVALLEAQVESLQRALQTREHELTSYARRLRVSQRLGQSIATILDLDRLLNQVVEIVRGTGNHYHASIALVEENGLVFKAIAGHPVPPDSLLGRRLPLGEGIIGWVARTGDSLLVPDVSLEPRYVPLPELPETRAELAVSLSVQGRVIGVLDVRSDRVGGLDEDDLALMHSLAPQIAAAVENAQLFTWTDEARRRVDLLYRISRRLESSLDLSEVLNVLLELTLPSVEAEHGSIFVLDEAERPLAFAFTPREWPLHEARRRVEAVLEQGLAGWVVRHRRGVVLADATTDERWFPLPDGPTVGSVVAVPLVRRRQVIGVLTLTHPRAYHFTPAHLSLLNSIAGQAAIAVENARLLAQTRQRVRELSILNEIGQASASLHLDEVLSLVVERTARALRADRCAIFLHDERRGEWVLRAASNHSQPMFSLERGIPLRARPHVAEAAATLRPVEIPNIYADERLRDLWPLARQMGLEALLAVPLVVKDKAIGVLSLDRGGDHPPFSPEEVALCQTIAHQAAAAIDNARLYEETQRRAEQLRLVNEIGYEVSTTLDLDYLLWQVVRLIQETFDCYLVSIGLVEGDELVFKADVGYAYEQPRITGLRLRLGKEGITGWVARHGQSLLVPDVSREPRYYAVDTLPDTRSELAVPLRLHDRVIGVLDVQGDRVNAFDYSDQILLEALANQVAVAVENARLFSTVREEQAKLEAIINGTGDAIIVVDESGQVLLMNPAARRAFEVPPTASISAPLLDVVSHPALEDLWRQARWKRSPCSGEIPLTDGRTLLASLTPVSGVGWVMVMQDITTLKELDRMKSEFVSTVSHDLRSPLQAIQSSAELILRLGQVNEEQREAAQQIMSVVAQMSQLVQDLLDIGKIEAGVGMEMEPCDLEPIIRGAVAGLEHRVAQKGLALSVEIPSPLPRVMGNPARLAQVVQNLVDNAIKYTPAGSVRVQASHQGGEVIVEVRDTGIGISPQDQKHIFEKFYRVSHAARMDISGTGLGLAIVKSIIDHHGGRVWVESIPNEGSSFFFALPVLRQAYGES